MASIRSLSYIHVQGFHDFDKSATWPHFPKAQTWLLCQGKQILYLSRNGPSAAAQGVHTKLHLGAWRKDPELPRKGSWAEQGLRLKGWSGPGGRPRARSWQHKQGRRLRSSPHNKGAGSGGGRSPGATEARPDRGQRSARLTSAMLAVHRATQQRPSEGAGRSLSAPARPPPPLAAAVG